jgi:4-aminobutyrate aminotransferase
MIGIELVRDQITREGAPELRDRIVQLAFHKGLLLLGAGENSLRLCPPLLIDNEQAEFAVGALDACISEVENSL